MALLGIGLVAGGFIGWAVQNWDDAKAFIANRKYNKILADFQERVPQEKLESFAGKLSDQLASTHPASQKALSGRLRTIQKMLTSFPDQEQGAQKLGWHLQRLQGEMRRAEQFVKKSNKGYNKRRR